MPLRKQRVIHPDKLANYLLDVTLRDGAPKARFFTAHGFTKRDLATFEAALFAHAATNPTIAVQDDGPDRRVVIGCHIVTPDGRNPCITSVWQHDAELHVYRLITAYPRSRS